MAGAASGWRAHVGAAGAAVLSQGVVAGSSLVLQWLALWQLGRDGLGTFAILSGGIVVTVTALHTGWVGDPLAIVDRHAPALRRALRLMTVGSIALATVGGTLAAAALTDLGWPTAGLFGVALGAWVAEESGRRLMMARLDFWSLVANDVAYALGALGAAGVGVATGRLTMGWLIGSMLVGSLAAVVAALRQLPAEELRAGPRVRPDFAEIARFSVWRSGQLAMRPLGMLGSRVVVQSLTSTSTLGLIEAGRLLVAPVLTAANGFGGFILPWFARRHRERELDLGVVARVSGICAAAALACLPAAFLLRPLVERIDGSGSIPTPLVVAWCCFAVGYAANIPLVNALTSARHSRDVFLGRVVDAALVLVLTWLAVVVGAEMSVPALMTLGMVVGTSIPVVLLWRRGEVPVPALVVRLLHGDRPASGSAWWPGAGRRRTWSVGADGRTRPRGPWARWGVVAAVLGTIVATDYDWRRRELAGSLEGSLDVAVLVELGVYGLVAAVLALAVLEPPRWRRPTAVVFFTRAWVAIAAVSALWSAYPLLGIVRGGQLVVLCALALAIGSRADGGDLVAVAQGFVALAVASVGIGLVWRVPFSDLQADRFNWMAVHSVVAGAILAVATVVAAALGIAAARDARWRGARTARPVDRRARVHGTARAAARRAGAPTWHPFVYLAAFAVTTAGLLATQTRGSVAGAVVGLVVVAFLSVRPTSRPVVGLAALGGTGVVAIFGSEGVAAYLARGESAQSLQNLNSRLPLWELAIELVGERPLLGWGLGASRGLFYDRIGLGGAHNAYVNVVVDSGLLGLAAWLAMVGAVCVGIARLHRARHNHAVLLAGVMACQLTNAMTTEGMGSGAGVSTIWLLLTAGWVGVAQRDVARRRTVRRPVPRPAAQPAATAGTAGELVTSSSSSAVSRSA